MQDWLVPWAEENGIELLDWPPYSPDLNPIENLWSILKQEIYKRYPHYSTLPSNDATKRLLIATATEVWHKIEVKVMRKLVSSMKRRLKAVIRAKGWYTKY